MQNTINDFTRIEAQIREEFTPLLSISEVRKILGCSSRVVVNLIERGELNAYSLYGSRVSRTNLKDASGLRITPSSLRAYLDDAEVK